MIEAIWLQVTDMWHQGGVVMPALFATAFVLWYSLGLRVLLLQRGDARGLRTLVAAYAERPDLRARGIIATAAQRGSALWVATRGPVARPYLDEAFADLEERLQSGTMLVRCLIAMSPLLGLLGTVSGLIETFGSLGQSTTSTASEGIAGGIVEALYATQMGLAIAVPGLLMGGVLHHKEQKLTLELDELKAVLSGALHRVPA